MGAACNKIQKPHKPNEKLATPTNPKNASSGSINGGGSKAILPMLQQPQLNSLIMDEANKAKPQSPMKKNETCKGMEVLIVIKLKI